MSFISSEFIFLIVCLLIVYYFLGTFYKKYQWVVLLIASLVYYCSETKILSIYLVLTVLVSWLCANRIQNIEIRYNNIISEIQQAEEKKKLKKEMRTKAEKRKKVVLLCALLPMLGMLAFLKCRPHFIFDSEMTKFNWFIMPLGISFFTFFSVGYCVDVYRGTVPAEKNILKYALYICYFPHIGQGPLDRYEELMPQLTRDHQFDRYEFRLGIERVLIGYFKKLVIANNLSLFIDPVYSAPVSYSGIVLIFATLMYAIQIYADFSGYMDIACGISRCLGIKLTENFETPYFSKSIAEYWRRWHISLGAWFRDYLYYPILRSSFISKISKGLRAKGKKMIASNISTSIGLLLTWSMIGFWHGSNWNFIIHGLYHGGIIIISTWLGGFYIKCRTKLNIREESLPWNIFQVVRTFIIVCIGYIFFRSDSMETAVTIISRIAGAFYYEGWSVGLFSEKLDKLYWICMFFGIAMMLLMDLIERKEPFLNWLNSKTLPVRWSLLYIFMMSVLFVVVFSNIKEAGAGNFIYYNF